jgi:hypothetical protein
MRAAAETGKPHGRAIGDLIAAVSIALVVLDAFFFLVAVHLLIAAIAPAVIYHSLATLAVVIISLAVSVFSGVGTLEGRQRGSMPATLIAVVYSVVALIAGSNSSYPGLYTVPFAFAGTLGAGLFLADFGRISLLFSSIPKWRSQPHLYSTDFIRDELVDFDRRVSNVTVAVIATAALFVALSAVALSTTDRVTAWFTLIAAPFLWTSTVIVVFTRILLRLKRMYLAGHTIEEHHLVRPLVTTIVGSLAILVAAGLLAGDSSPFHYSTLTASVESMLNIDPERREERRRAAYDDGLEYPTSPTDSVDSAGEETTGSEQLPEIVKAPDVEVDLRTTLVVLRFVALGIGVAVAVWYVVVSVLRMRRVDRKGARLRDGYRSGRRRFRIALLRVARLWRLFAAGVLDALRRSRRSRRLPREAERGLEAATLRRAHQRQEVMKAIEMGSILRWYRRLVAWGRRNGVAEPKAATADEYLSLIAGRFPEHAAATGRIAVLFDEACYSPGSIGRAKIREYAASIRSIMNVSKARRRDGE